MCNCNKIYLTEKTSQLKLSQVQVHCLFHHCHKAPSCPFSFRQTEVKTLIGPSDRVSITDWCHKLVCSN